MIELNGIKTFKHWKLFIYVSFFFFVSLTEIYYSGGLNYYFTTNLGLSLKNESLIWVVFSFLSLIITAIISIITDRFVGRANGRRIPFLRWGGLFYGLFFGLVFIHPLFGNSQLGLCLYYLLSLLLLNAGMTFTEQAIYAVPSEELTDLKERSKTYMVLGIIALVSFAVSIYVLLPSIQPGTGESLTFFRIIMGGLGIIASVCFFISSFFIPHTFVQNVEVVRKAPKLKTYFACFKNKRFLIGEIFLTSTVACNMTLILTYFYMVDYCESFSDAFLFMAIIGGIFAYVFIRMFYHKIASRKVFGTLGIIAGLCFVINAILFNQGDFFFLGFFGAGISGIIQFTCNNIILSECVDDDAEKSGFRKEAEYYSLDIVFDSLGGLSQSAFLLIISALGFIEGNNAQTQEVQDAIVLAGFLLPGLLTLIGSVITFIFYPNERNIEQYETSI